MSSQRIFNSSFSGLDWNLTLLSDRGKLHTSRGSVTTKVALAALERFASQLEKDASKDKRTVKKAYSIAKYLKDLSLSRLDGAIETRCSNANLRSKVERATALCGVFSAHLTAEEKASIDALPSHSASLSMHEEESVIMRRESPVKSSLTEHTTEKFTDAKAIEKRLRQIQRDMDRGARLKIGDAKSTAAASRYLGDIEEMIQGQDEATIMRWFTALDEATYGRTSATKEEKIARASKLYGVNSVGQTEKQILSSILARRIALFASSTSNLTLHTRLGMVARINPTSRSVLEFRITKTAGSAIAEFALKMNGLDVDTSRGALSGKAYRADISLSCDPIQGLIKTRLVLNG